jgi:hypothetical protein
VTPPGRAAFAAYNCGWVRGLLLSNQPRFSAQLETAVRVLLADNRDIPDREVLSRQLLVTPDSINELNVEECRAEAYGAMEPWR